MPQPSSFDRLAFRLRPPALPALVLGTLSAACAAPRAEPAGSPLPFHVAVVPLGAEDVTEVEPMGAPARASDETSKRGSRDDLTLRLDADTISSEVARELDGEVFTLASLLEPPPDGVDVDDTYWIEGAERAGADLLLYCERLHYVPSASTRRINFLSSSLPLFLLGGPFVYFIDDRDYTVDAQLSARLIDLNRVGWDLPRAGERLELGRRVAHGTFDARPDPVRLNFTQRVESGDLGAWGASVVIPTGFLEIANATVEAAVTREASASLGRNLGHQIRGRAREILQPEGGGASSFLDLDTFRAEPRDDGRLDVGTDLLLRRSKSTTGLARATLYVGGEAIECDFRSTGTVAEGALERFAIAGVAPAPAPRLDPSDGSERPGVLRLEVVDTGTVRGTRSWTFPVPTPEAGTRSRR